MKQPLLIAVLMLMFACGGYEKDSSADTAKKSGVSFVKTAYSEASAQASKAEKMMLLDFYAVW